MSHFNEKKLLQNGTRAQTLIRIATEADIPAMQRIRHAVKENVLSDPALVKDEDYVAYLSDRGRGWVCETNGLLTGFAIADLTGSNIWALFVDPQYERMGIGRQLHDTMLDWYFGATEQTVWLSTAEHTRAAAFYTQAGWQYTGPYGKYELRFEMSRDAWNARKHQRNI